MYVCYSRSRLHVNETILHHKFHLDQHSVMLNITARLAIKLRYLPSWEIDWSDNNPQANRESLTLEDFLPDEEDSKAFTERAVEYTMRFFVSEFPGLADLAKTLPEQQPLHPVVKTEAVPQKYCLRMRSTLVKQSTFSHS